MFEYRIIRNGIEYDVRHYIDGNEIIYILKLNTERLCFCIYPGHYKSWYKDTVLHREDDAAVINASGIREYWLKGIKHADVNSNEECIIKQIIE